MKGLDIAIVRLSPIFLFILIGVNIFTCWNGEQSLFITYFHSNSVFYALFLFLVSLSNKKYHCIWNRAMYVELMLFPLTNYIDAKFNLFPDVILYLRIITGIYLASLIATIYLGVRHFVISRKNRYKEFKLK